MQIARSRPGDASGSWGHWLMLCFALAAIAFALVIQRQLASGAGPHPAAAVPAAARLRSPVLVAGHQGKFYRQFMYLVMIHSMATALTGVRLRWHKLTRTGVEVRQT